MGITSSWLSEHTALPPEWIVLEFSQYLATYNSSSFQKVSQPQRLNYSGPAICTSVSIRTLTPCTFNSWQKWLFHLLKIL